MNFKIDYRRARLELLAAIEERKPARLWIQRSNGRVVGRQRDIAAASNLREQDIQALRKSFPSIRTYDGIMIDVADVAQAFAVRTAQSQLTTEAQ